MLRTFMYFLYKLVRSARAYFLICWTRGVGVCGAMSEKFGSKSVDDKADGLNVHMLCK